MKFENKLQQNHEKIADLKKNDKNITKKIIIKINKLMRFNENRIQLKSFLF